MSQSAKSCIHCRYTKCLEIGMNPELLKGERGVSGGRRRDSRQSSQSSPAPPVAESQVSQGTEGTSYPRPSVIRPVQPLVDQLTQQDGRSHHSYLKTELNNILQEISDPRMRLTMRPLLLHNRGTSLITRTRFTSYPSPTERTSLLAKWTSC